jgi:hypothetical protein
MYFTLGSQGKHSTAVISKQFLKDFANVKNYSIDENSFNTSFYYEPNFLTNAIKKQMFVIQRLQIANKLLDFC